MKILLIGQGISGTWLSYWFVQMGTEITVLDEQRTNTSTRVASGVINPVTGRQVVTTWLADELFPFAEEHYTNIGKIIGADVIRNCGILAFPPSGQMMEAYQQKISKGSPFVHPLADAGQFEDYFRFLFGAVHILPAYWVDLQTLQAGWRQWLNNEARLREGHFDETLLKVHADGVEYKDIQADYAFYCDGIHTAQSKYWGGLPFSFNKGEALIADIPGLPYGQIYKFGISTLVPWHGGKWWVGSTYDNRFTDDQPTETFRKRTEQFLELTLKLPFTIEDHIAAIRPATVERRPFAGLHPHSSRVGILGGLGTKGVSLAPWLAKQLAAHILDGAPIEPAANVQRFKRAFM